MAYEDVWTPEDSRRVSPPQVMLALPFGDGVGLSLGPGVCCLG